MEHVVVNKCKTFATLIKISLRQERNSMQNRIKEIKKLGIRARLDLAIKILKREVITEYLFDYEDINSQDEEIFVSDMIWRAAVIGCLDELEQAMLIVYKDTKHWTSLLSKHVSIHATQFYMDYFCYHATAREKLICAIAAWETKHGWY
jgi:hypothetical protein